jgi:hypothetical protein
LAHRYSIEVRGDHVWVHQEGALATVADARAMQAEIAAASAKTGADIVVFDNRATTEHAEDVREAMFEFVSKHSPFRKVALLLESELLAVRVNMTALSRHAMVRAFGTAEDALAWLRCCR